MSSLEDLANRVVKAYKSFDIDTIKKGNVCSYDPKEDVITLNFSIITRYLDHFRILHELSHRIQRQETLLYGNTSEIELNANRIAYRAYEKLGFPLTYEVTRHINYNNLHNLNPRLTQREIIRKIAGKKELIWRLPTC